MSGTDSDRLKYGLLQAAALSSASGYHNDWGEKLDAAALAAGNTQAELDKAKEEARPKVKQLQEALIRIQKNVG